MTSAISSSSVSSGTISSAGVGSGLDVTGIVSQLMTVESQPLVRLTQKEAGYTATLTAYSSLSSALSTFQTAVSGLSDVSKFQPLAATPSDTTVLSATATTKSPTGTYNINVSQIAQAQSIATKGQASITSSIGAGAATTLSFQFGTISGGTFGSASVTGSAIDSSIASAGMTANALSINGSTITTDSSIKSAKALASAINLKTGTTTVTATATPNSIGGASTLFGTHAAATNVTLVDGNTSAYSLSVGGVVIYQATQANDGTNATIQAANIDAGGAGHVTGELSLASASVQTALSDQGITVTGTAAGGDLKFTNANGDNLNVVETISSGVGATGAGFNGEIVVGNTSNTSYNTSSVSLSSTNAITIAGTAPSTVGLSAGSTSNGVYVGASFTQDANQSAGTVSIGSNNNSLQGIRDAINAANIGVTATIVSDSSASPYHLVISSNKTGATSSMKVSVTGDSALAGLLSYDPASSTGQKMTQSLAGQDAKLTVNGIAVSSATNTVSEAIQGVTLNVSKAGSTSLSIARDTSSVQTNVNAFVTAYNTIQKNLASVTSYNIQTGAAGSLQGDATVLDIKNGIRSVLSKTVSGLSGGLNSLAQIGVTFQKDGSLALDSTVLQKALSNNFNDVAGLFATVGTTSDSLINYAGASTTTTPGHGAVTVTQLATQGYTSGSAAAGLTITKDVNDRLSVTVDGLVSNVTLQAGTYTPAALAAQVQSVVNGSSTLITGNIGVSVTADNSGVLTMKSNQYGSHSNISVSNNAAITLFGATPSIVTGKDVAGTIGGVDATGSGQFLTAAAGSGMTGLKLQVTGGALGARGSVNYSQGYAFQFTKLVDDYVGSTGLISSRTKGINSTITSLKSQETGWQNRLLSIQNRYKKQFSALDSSIGAMKTTSTYLTQQLSLISAQSTSK
jgi:flagellar hook-associated protein 2